MPETPYIEVLETLRMLSCPVCGAMHAVAAAFFLAARQNQTPIHCPQGHAWTPLAIDAGPSSNPAQTHTELLANLSDARAKLVAAQQRISELTPIGTPSLKELRRRSNLLADRAEEKDFGRALCPLCGKQKSKSNLAAHIRRQHHEELVNGSTSKGA